MSIPSTTIEQIENMRSSEINYRTLHSLAVIKDESSGRNIEIPLSSLTNKYRDFLSTIVTAVTFSDDIVTVYKYNPKALSQALYGTTELWNDLLILNNCVSVVDFTPTTVKAYDPIKLKSYINEILILEGLAD